MKLATQSLVLALGSLALVACSKVKLPSSLSKDNVPFVHRIDIQQGNVITQEMIAQLELGMDKKKVEFIMGSPIITDTFHNDRWDYVYSYQKGHELAEQRRVTLFFRDNLLAKVEGDVVAARGEIVTEERRMESVKVPPGEKPTLFSRVKSKLPLGEDDSPDQLKDEAKKALPEASTNQPDDVTEAAEAQAVEKAESVVEPVAESKSEEATVQESAEGEEEAGFFSRMWDKISGGDE